MLGRSVEELLLRPSMTKCQPKPLPASLQSLLALRRRFLWPQVCLIGVHNWMQHVAISVLGVLKILGADMLDTASSGFGSLFNHHVKVWKAALGFLGGQELGIQEGYI